MTLGLLAISGMVGLVLMTQNWENFHTELSRVESLKTLTSEMISDIQAARWHVEIFKRKPGAELANNAQTHIARIQSKIKRLRDEAIAPENIRQLEALGSSINEYRIVFTSLEEAFRTRGFDEGSGYRGSFRKAAHELEQYLFANDTSTLIPMLGMLGHHIDDLVRLSESPRVSREYIYEINSLIPHIHRALLKSRIEPVFNKEVVAKLDAFAARMDKLNSVSISAVDVADIVNLYEDLNKRIRTRDFGELRLKYLELRRREKDYLLRGNDKYVDMVKDLVVRAESDILLLNKEPSAGLLMQGKLQTYQDSFLLLVKGDTLITSIAAQLNNISDTLTEQLHIIEEIVERTSKFQIIQLVNSGDRTALSLIILGCLTLIAAVCFALRFSLGLSRPLRQAVTMLKALEEGDFGQRLKLGRADEIGDMSRALDGLAETLENAMFAIVCALTDRDQAMISLDRELAQSKAILAGFDGYIYVCSPDKRIEFMNSKLVDRTGRDATGELCYKALHDLDDVCDWCPNVNLESGLPYQWEIQSPKDDRWYSIVNTLIDFPENEQRKLAMIRDITAPRQAAQALQRSEERYRMLFANSPFPIWVVDMQSSLCLDVNQTAIDKYGYSREEFLGMAIMDLHPDEDPSASDKAHFDIYKGLGKIGFWRHQCKDGRVLDVEINVKGLHYDSRSVCLVVANDITDKENLRRELDQSSRLAAIGELAAGVAHEINNPNGMLLMNLGLLTDVHHDLGPILDEHYAKNPDLALGNLPYSIISEKLPYLLSEMTAGGLRIKRIVEDLKGFARKDTTDEMIAIDINEVVAAAIRLVSYQLDKATSSFLVDYTENLPKVKGVFTRLEQVVVNLLINATQALENREQRISLLTGFSLDKKFLVVKVEDCGKGISPEYRDKIFDPFFTSRRNEGGTGLGLALSQRIAEEHGGFLRVLADPASKTVIGLHLPFIADD